MKTFVLACLFVAAASAASLPAAHQRLHRRDVSELLAESSAAYLPPAEHLEEAATEAPATAAPEDSATLGDAGYEYRTVRRLKYRLRSRRDVSHLNLHYLPPSNEYLPPASAAPEAEEVVVDAAEPRPSNEYLPPAVRAVELPEDQPQAEAETEAPVAVGEEPEESVPEAVEQAPEEAPVEAEAEAPAQEAAEEEQPAPVEEEQDTAVLAEDGYHYKQPEQVPPQLRMAVDDAAPVDAAPVEAEAEEAAPVPAAGQEYLPPVDGEGVLVEGPGEETAVLADDGYHYRAVKRFRF